MNNIPDARPAVDQNIQDWRDFEELVTQLLRVSPDFATSEVITFILSRAVQAYAEQIAELEATLEAQKTESSRVIEDLQAGIAKLETELRFQQGWGGILEAQKEKDRVVKKEVERNSIIILRQALSKLSSLSPWLKNRTDIWFVSPKQITKADRKEYIERYNEIIELLTWAVLLAQSLATIDPEDETYKQTFNKLQKLRQQREEIKMEWDFFELLTDVYVTDFHNNLNRIASALTTSVDVKYRSDIEEPDWLARTHIANQRPL